MDDYPKESNKVRLAKKAMKIAVERENSEGKTITWELEVELEAEVWFKFNEKGIPRSLRGSIRATGADGCEFTIACPPGQLEEAGELPGNGGSSKTKNKGEFRYTFAEIKEETDIVEPERESSEEAY